MKKLILGLYMLVKSLLPCKKPIEKRVLEKINISKPIKKKRYVASKKQGKKKCQK